MSKRHFFLYDFLLPLAGIAALGRFFSDHFDSFVFQWLDSIKPFGLGLWFSHSPLRQNLWDSSWLFFAAVPAVAWMIWVRINMEYDWVNSCRRLDRPIYAFFRGLARWVEGGSELEMVRQGYERRLAIEHDRVRRLEAELAEARGPSGESYDQSLESEEEWQDEYLPPAQQG
ncbi:MAG: hypothetical protein JWO30_2171 [Fibrobacteres bacterium]|nr:hypothetical protein [Fibrobacterota bacterium]